MADEERNRQTEEELGEDPRILEDIAEATGKLEDLLRRNEIELDYWEADWRDTEGLITGALDMHKKYPSWHVTYFSGDELGIDANYVFFTSKPVDDSVIHEAARLIIDEGAELLELPTLKCPKCGKVIDCLVGSYPASVPAMARIIDGGLYMDWMEDIKIGDVITGEVETWCCPECDEVLFSKEDPDWLDKMTVFLKGE
jgi:hypothetical protein